jgi:hypothetical protein
MLEKMKGEPVALGALARILVVLGSKYGIALSDAEVLGLLVALEPIVSILTRRLVTPVAVAATKSS